MKRQRFIMQRVSVLRGVTTLLSADIEYGMHADSKYLPPKLGDVCFWVASACACLSSRLNILRYASKFR